MNLTCKKCGTLRQINTECKPCKKKYATEYRKNSDYQEKARLRSKKRYENNPGCRKNSPDNRKNNQAYKDRTLLRIRKYREENKEMLLIQSRKKAEILTDDYVVNQLRISIKDATPELIEMKRNQMLTKRLIKQLNEVIQQGITK